MSKETLTLPREDLIRGAFGGTAIALGTPPGDASIRADGGGQPVLEGHFAVYNVWTEIDSWYEGKFLERLAPGSAKKTLKERGDRIRCLFQHGYDFVVGDKPLGPFERLEEDGDGIAYSVPLLATQYNAELIPGLRAGLYGASFRFRVMREEIVEEPGVSDYNPQGLPERTIKEIELFEGGPVTFGAYPEATAELRMCSLTDEFLVERMARHPERLREVLDARKASGDPRTLEVQISGDAETVANLLDAPSDADAESVEPERREQEKKDKQETQDTEAPPTEGTPKVKDYLHGTADKPSWFLP